MKAGGVRLVWRRAEVVGTWLSGYLVMHACKYAPTHPPHPSTKPLQAVRDIGHTY